MSHLPPGGTVATAAEVSVLDGDGTGWDAFVAAQPDASFCHLSGWRSVMSDVLGNESRFLQAIGADGELEAVLPLVDVRSALFGRFLVSMPFLNYGGPLGAPAAKQRLVQEAVGIAARRNARLLELRTRHEAPPALRRADRRITVVLPLPDTDAELWDAFPSKLRSQVRRPLKAGLTASFGRGLVDPFYAVYSHTMRDLGTPVLPRRFFEEICRRLGEHALIGVVTLPDGEPVAAGFGFEWQGEVEITWAGALRAFSPQAPNMLLYWAFMQETIRRGCSAFNFGRCRPDGGTHRFKRQWGGHDVPLPWGVWASAEASVPSPEKGMYQTAVRAWQRLPLPVANAIGPFLARRLP